MKKILIICCLIISAFLLAYLGCKIYKHFNPKKYSYVINPTLDDIKKIGKNNIDYIEYNHFGEVIEEPVIYKGSKAIQKYEWLASLEIGEATDIEVLDDSSDYTIYTKDGKSYTISFSGGYLSYNGVNYTLK